MAEVTTNLGLTKPLPEEFYDIAVQNENMDKIDEAIGNTNGVPLLDENGVLSVPHRSFLLTNEDLNDIVVDGYYRARTTHQCLNVPNDVTAFGLLVLRIGENIETGGNCNQILVPYGSVGNIIYTRIVTEGQWDNWRKIALMDHVVSKTGDTMSGELIIDETSGFYGVSKKRTITDGTTYKVTLGVGFDGSAALELRSAKDNYATVVNRLNLSPAGNAELVGENTSYTIIHTGNISQYVSSAGGLIPATVE